MMTFKEKMFSLAFGATIVGIMGLAVWFSYQEEDNCLERGGQMVRTGSVATVQMVGKVGVVQNHPTYGCNLDQGE